MTYEYLLAEHYRYRDHQLADIGRRIDQLSHHANGMSAHVERVCADIRATAERASADIRAAVDRAVAEMDAAIKRVPLH
jgi:hypothetical protein